MEEQRLRATASYGTLPSYTAPTINTNMSNTFNKPNKHSPILESTKKSNSTTPIINNKPSTILHTTSIHNNAISEIIEEDFASERNNPWRMKKRLSQKVTVTTKNTKRKRAATFSAGYNSQQSSISSPFEHPYADAVNSFSSTQNLFCPPSHVIEEDVEENDYSDADNPTLVSQYRIVSCSPRITPPQGTTPRVGNAKIITNATFTLNEEFVDVDDDDGSAYSMSTTDDDDDDESNKMFEILTESPEIKNNTFKDFNIINSDSSGEESVTPNIKQIKIDTCVVFADERINTYKNANLLGLPLISNTMSSYSNISAHTADIDDRLLPKHQYLQMNAYSTFSNMCHPRMTEYASMLLNTVNNHSYNERQAIALDLSDDEFVVEMPVGDFHASLFMRVWLNIASYLTQNEKLLSLQFVSRKFRAIALATNHWQSISIALPMDIDQNMIKFLFSISTTVNSINILNSASLMMDNERCCSILKSVLGNATDLLCIQIASNNMSEYSFCYFPSLMRILLSLSNISQMRELRVYGCVNIEDMNEFLMKSVNIRSVCFDICEEDEKELLCDSLPMEIEEFWIPRCTTEQWMGKCLVNKHMLRCLLSFPKILHMNHTSVVMEEEKESCVVNEMMIKPEIVYDRYCFSAACLHLIADECIDIQCISIHCKLNIQFAEALKYLLSKCDDLQCIRLSFSIAFYIFEEIEFWMKFAELKIECLKILEEFSFKYHCCSSVYFKNEYEMNESNCRLVDNSNCTQQVSEYDLIFILYKK